MSGRKEIRGGPVQTFNEDYSESCPMCGTTITDDDHGFGLAYGGFGSYISCPNGDCEWWIKECEVDDEEATDGN